MDMMNSDYSGIETSTLCEIKKICKKIQGFYNDLKEEITPYKDDRFYRLAPMRLYTLTRRHFAVVFVVFLMCFGLTVFVGVAGPKIITENFYNGLSTSANGSKTGPFYLKSPTLSNYNQQLWLTCLIQIAQINEEEFRKKFDMNVDLKGVIQDASIMDISNNVQHKSRVLHCATPQELCDEIIIVHLGYLNYTQYKINVTLKDLEGISQNIQNVTFVVKTYNPTFSQVEIWFRFVFVVITFTVTCMFAHSLRKFPMRDWGIEQKWMSILLPLLLLYNDPFFPLSFLTNSWFPGMLDAIFQALFLCALLLFWLCVYHGFRVQGERKCLTFYLPKLVLVGLLWFSAVILGIWQLVNELQDPTYQYDIDIKHFQGMKVFFLLLVAMYVLYLGFLLLRAWSELKNMPYSDLRLKFLTALTFLVLIISMIILYLRFGSKALQDNFVAELSIHYQNSAEFVSFYGLLNFYLYTLAFIYSPSKNTLYDSQLKDNPAFSMLNDSDDEVIYGSDYEVMPLQNGRAIKTPSKYQDETDSD
ncbi:transmembrane protein 181 isoform X1 [Electrophorus electricus]|uniref:transmembrane protein 181 isoform X1 n=1 Tax=Electrophorus electricus TaxID=8005 RepID=UPI0015D0C931|nr:transmembrane protein 181 isoform X1 [Electrophorus electricus]